jgi:hypothetical protein
MGWIINKYVEKSLSISNKHIFLTLFKRRIQNPIYDWLNSLTHLLHCQSQILHCLGRSTDIASEYSEPTRWKHCLRHHLHMRCIALRHAYMRGHGGNASTVLLRGACGRTRRRSIAQRCLVEIRHSTVPKTRPFTYQHHINSINASNHSNRINQQRTVFTWFKSLITVYLQPRISNYTYAMTSERFRANMSY